MRWGQLLIGITALALGSCTSSDTGSSAATTTDPSPLARCTSTEELLESDGTAAVSVTPSDPSPGSTMTVTWNIDPAEEITLGDELRIDCWDGEAWQTAWATFAIFGAPRSVVPASRDADGFVFTDDAWNDREGRIPIPMAAPPGDYRFETDFRIGPDRVRSEHTIYFSVRLSE